MSRSIRREVFVGAPPDVVWSALTDAEELTRWFPVRAMVDAGPGGSIWLSWGEGSEGRAPITAWEPNRRFGWAEERGATRIAVDFHLEPREGGTVVRLVQSGFGDGPDWDDEYHMTEGGWRYFLEHLRWYLERHRGTPRDLIVLRRPAAMTRREAFARLTRALGLGAATQVQAGTAYAAPAAPDAVPLSGTVVSISEATGQMGVTVETLGDAILFLEMEPHPDGCQPGFWLSTYGLDPARLDEVRSRFGDLYDRALQAP
jgi:uncharacterized protein YndB with AHSA1/START domain